MTTEDSALRETLRRIELLVNTLSSAVDSLNKTVVTLQTTMVTKEGLANLEARVTNVEKGVDENDARWARISWFVGLAVAAAILGLVIGRSGGL